MNKKSLMGLTLAAVITLSSTSVIAFASQNTEKSTRNVVKVVNNNVSAAKSNVAIQNHDITNDKAIEIAKKALNDYLGVDIEAKIKTDGLKITVNNYKTDIMVVFDKTSNGSAEASVDILKQDGKARFVAWRGDRENKEFSYDAAKVKQAAQKYLNEKGLDKNIKSITASDELKEGGVFSAVCEYTDGSSVNLEFNGKDYSPVLYCSIPKPVKVDAKSQNSNITDEKAKQLAGDVLSKYLGVDINQKIKDEALETRVDRFDDEILISFNESIAKAQKDSNSKIRMLNGDFSVTISAKDGSMTSVCGIDNLEEKEYPFDEAKIKDAAAKYLKNKGFDTNVQSITADNEKQKIGLVGADCKYADGSTVLLELSAKDYSVVCVSVYGASK